MASIATLNKMKARIEGFRKATARAREKAGEATQTIVASAEIGGAAFLHGLATGRYGEEKLKIAGVPLGLGLGVGANVLALVGVGRGMEDHLRNLGNGALAGYLSNLGLRTGAKLKSEAGVSGELPGDDAVMQLLTPGSVSGGEGVYAEEFESAY